MKLKKKIYYKHCQGEQLEKAYFHQLGVLNTFPSSIPFPQILIPDSDPHRDYFGPIKLRTDVRLDVNGMLTIFRGYTFEPSGPTFHTKSFMRGALVHDALYQLIRNKLLPEATWRKFADKELRDICIEDGMWEWRANLIYKTVRAAGGASVVKPRKIYEAP